MTQAMDSTGPLMRLVGRGSRATHVLETLKKRGYRPHTSPTAAEAVDAQQGAAADVVLLALPIPGGGSRRLIEQLRAIDRTGTIVVLASDDEIRGAPDALAAGAHEYVEDPVANPSELLGVIGVSLGVRKSDAMLRHLRAKDHQGAEPDAVVGQCEAMRQVMTLVQQVCRRSVSGASLPILITGETGTGKSLLAKYIHYNGARRNEPLVDLNCAAIPGALIEAELFGHERGAFTDAKSRRAGLFETANRGSLFLDEIGALPLELQPKLLTAIEEQSIRRIGGRTSMEVDVQVIAATLNNLGGMVKRGEFRRDLYHRLRVIRIRMPALRERGTDVLRLAENFISAVSRRYGLPRRRLGESARDLLVTYPWPGNVRELKNEIERVLLLEDGDTIEDFHFHLRPSVLPPTPVPAPHISSGPPPLLSIPPEGIPLEEIERQALEDALRQCDGNVSRAARFLSITRQTMIYRMQKHGIDKPTKG